MDVSFLPILAALILSIVIHEVSHGFMANWLGDPTARLAGRLTLNPIPHIDPVGSLLLPIALVTMQSPFLIGYAKPVPYNPYNLKNQRWGEALVAFAGPGVNIIIALVFALVVRGAITFGAEEAFIVLALYIVKINMLLALFNLIPIPPADGSKVLSAFLPPHLEMRYREFGNRIGIFGLVLLFGFMIYFGGPFYALLDAAVSVLTGLPA